MIISLPRKGVYAVSIEIGHLKINYIEGSHLGVSQYRDPNKAEAVIVANIFDLWG